MFVLTVKLLLLLFDVLFPVAFALMFFDHEEISFLVPFASIPHSTLPRSSLALEPPGKRNLLGGCRKIKQATCRHPADTEM